MNPNRVKTDIDRKAEYKDNIVTITSDVKEVMPVDVFFETVSTKQSQVSQLTDQLNGVKAQIKVVRSQLPNLSEAEEAELMELKRKINMIRDLDKLETLQQNAQKMEVDLALIKKESVIFKEVIDKINKDEIVYDDPSVIEYKEDDKYGSDE